MTRTTGLFVGLLTSGAALGHHSLAEYDRSVVEEFEGEVVRVLWRNPHVRFTIRTHTADGSEEIWELEAMDVNSLDRRNVPHDLVQAGDRVRVAGSRSTRRVRHMNVSNLLLPGNEEILLRGAAEPRWSRDYIGGGDWVIDEPEASANAPRGIFRVWTPGQTNPPAFLNDPPLTESARAGHAAYDPTTDDPVLQCIPYGMPRATTAGGPHPIEFIERGDDIVIEFETFNNTRVIHMDSQADPSEQPASPMGYSVGQWEEDTLVVTTTRVSWPFFDLAPLIGVPQREAVEIVERFHLTENDTRLVYDITVTDPATFTEPITANAYKYWRWQPGVEVKPYDCTVG